MALPTDNPNAPINKEAALEICDGDEELFLEIAGVYLEDASPLMTKLQDALESGDAKNVEKHSHALKGASANICAESVRDTAQKMERLGRSGDLSQSVPLFKTLKQEFTRLQECLHHLLSASS